MTDLSSLQMSDSLIDLDASFLPVGHMRQIARVTALDGHSVEGRVDLGAGHWVWQEHFPGDPIFPGTLMIEAAGQLLALWAWARGQRGRPRLVRATAEFHRPVHPEIPHLTLVAEARHRRHLYFGTIQVSAGEIRVATVEAVLVVLPVD